MIYDLTDEFQREAYKKRCVSLFNKKAKVELIDKTNRSINQNSYLHVLIGFAAIKIGEPFEFVKQAWYKQRANRDLFVKEHTDSSTGEITTYLLSSTALTVEEMSQSIKRFRNWLSVELELDTPDPDNKKAITQIEVEIQRNKEFLW